MSEDDNKPMHYKCDLDHQLETCVQEYEEEREKFWQGKLEGIDWGRGGLFGHAEAVADCLLRDTNDLVDHDLLKDAPVQFTQEQMDFLNQMLQEARSLFASIEEKIPAEVRPALLQYFKDSALARRPAGESPLLKLVWERLCVKLAEDFAADRLVVGANRILQLSNLVVRGKPSLATLRFLRHISRCFIWGFDAECVILCRGAMDTAFANAVSDEICDKHGLRRASFGHTLANRITAACMEGIIDKRTKSAAFRVNTPATEAAHRNPDGVLDVLGIVEDTMSVIQRLVVAEGR